MIEYINFNKKEYTYQSTILARQDARRAEEEIGNCSMSGANLELHEEPAQI